VQRRSKSIHQIPTNSQQDNHYNKVLMKIWVDADACPKVIKDILFNAAIRTATNLILVSNRRDLSIIT